jgi:uncharacterized protein YfdQ (DUF2303 family)
MFTEEAIRAIQESHVVGSANAAVTAAATGARCDFAAIPEDLKLHDLEGLHTNRRRARGKMETRDIAAFVAYTNQHAELGATVFVSQHHKTATALLNLGSPQAPGHADNTAMLSPQQTAAYRALLGIVDGQRTQKQIAEFMEDWSDLIQCFSDTTEIKTAHAISAIRKITIDETRRQESAVESLSATRSDFERVQASSVNPLPTYIYFNCVPLAGFAERTFVLRLSVLTGDKEPRLILRIQKQEQHDQEIAEELTTKLTEAFDGSLPVLVGGYTKI